MADPLSIDCFSHLTESQIIPLVKCQELHYFLTSFETNLRSDFELLKFDKVVYTRKCSLANHMKTCGLAGSISLGQ